MCYDKFVGLFFTLLQSFVEIKPYRTSVICCTYSKKNKSSMSMSVALSLLPGICNSYTQFVRLYGEIIHTRGLSTVQADKLWYNYFIPPTSV